MVVIWIAPFLVPLIVAAAIGALSVLGGARLRRLREQLVRFSWTAVVPAAVAALVDTGAIHVVEWMLFGTAIADDAIARPLVLMAAGLYGLALSFVVRSSTDRPHVLTGFLLLCFVGNIGVFLAANLVTFYLMFAAMSFLGYAIVVHDRSPSARRAGAIYLVLTVFGESAVLAALMFIAAEGVTVVADAPAAVAASDRSGLIILLLLIGFGVKAGTVPLHVWLPLAHPVAPSPASAVLSGVMLKAGIVGWLRFLPLGEGEAEPVWGAIFIALALAGGLLAVPAGLLQDNPKVILAYSSIGQMGFITVLIGAALIAPPLATACIAAAVLYSVAHGLIKGALFLGVQSWDSERLPRWAVLGPLAVAGLALVGAPLTAGFIAKYAAKDAVVDVTIGFGSGVSLADVLPWIGVGSTLLMARFAVVMWHRAREPRATAWSRDVAWMSLSVGAVVPVAIAANSFSPSVTVPGVFDPAALWSQAWPVTLGLVLAVGVALLARRQSLSSSRVLHPHGDLVPSGDIVVAEERAVRAILRGMGRSSRALGDARQGIVGRVAGGRTPLPMLERMQRRLGSWAASGAVLAVLLALGLWLAMALSGSGDGEVPG